MEFTTKQRNEITGRAIANRLKGRNLTGQRLHRAIEEVADDMHGADTIAGQHLVELFENDTTGRNWRSVIRQAKQTLELIG